MESSVKILIVDDHPMVRRGLRQLLKLEVGFDPGWEAENAEDAQALASEHAFDLALVDISLGGTGGIELTKQLHVNHPELSVLIVSMHDEATYAKRALAAGANGYFQKCTSDEDLIRAARQVLAGERYLSETMRKRLDTGGKRDSG